MFNLHPKVQAALIAAILTGIASVAAAVKDVYPDAWWIGALSALIPVIVGYRKRSGVVIPLPVDQDPGADGDDTNAGKVES